MGGWSGGVYSRFRNWVTDKANSINPQAALFDQEDDGFAAGLNNCITKDGLSKPTSAMDWNGQNLTGVLNLANTGTVSLVGGKWTISLNGNLVGTAPVSGTAFALTGFSGASIANFTSGSGAAATVPDINVFRAGSTINTLQQGPNMVLQDTTNSTATTLQQSGGQTELHQFNGSWSQIWRVTTAKLMQLVDQAGNFWDIGWRDTPQNAQSNSYLCVMADRGKQIKFDTTAGATATIPANASVAYPLGTVLTFANFTPGTINIQITSDTLTLAGTSTTGTRTLAQFGIATASKVTSTNWLISGSGLS